MAGFFLAKEARLPAFSVLGFCLVLGVLPLPAATPAALRVHRFDQPVVKIQCGVMHTLALKKDGTVTAWGSNVAGEIDVPAGLTDVVDIVAGHSFSIALKKDNTLVAWGSNNYEQCDPPPTATDIVSLAAGYHHVLALKRDGTVVGWGANKHGQLKIPTDLGRVKAIAACFYQSFAIKEDGTLVNWGYNVEWQNTPPRALQQVALVASGGTFTLALKPDGQLVGWGQDYAGQASPPPGLHDVRALAASSRHHALALKSDGRVVAWGSNDAAQATVPPDLPEVVAIAVGWYHSSALGRDGAVYEWGRDNHGPGARFVCNCQPAPKTTEPQMARRQTRIYPGVSLTAIGAGHMHSLAVRQDGVVVAWGSNMYGQCRVPAGLRDVVAVAGGRDHSLALKKDGTVVAWGRNHLGQTDVPEGLREVMAIIAGRAHSAALLRDGRLVVWGEDHIARTNAASKMADVVSLAGPFNNLFVLQRGKVPKALGMMRAPWPHQYDLMQGAVAISGGFSHMTGLMQDGRLSVATDSPALKLPASAPTDVTAICSGFFHSLALKKDGTVFAWGENKQRQCDVPAGLRGVLQMVAGMEHSLCLSADGTLTCWGRYTEGQLEAPADRLKIPVPLAQAENPEPPAGPEGEKANPSPQAVKASSVAPASPNLRSVHVTLPPGLNFGDVGMAVVRYAGLIKPDADTLATAASEGFFSGAVSFTGSFTGRLWIHGRVHALAAHFRADGNAVFGGAPTLALADGLLTLHLGKKGIAIKLVRGEEVSQGLAIQALYDSRHPVPESLLRMAAREGFTLNLPPAQSLLGYLARPTGGDLEGRASLRLTRRGDVFLIGKLGDGAPLATSSLLTSGHLVPLYLPLQNATGPAAAFSGVLGLGPDDEEPTEEQSVLWYRQPQLTPLRPALTPP